MPYFVRFCIKKNPLSIRRLHMRFLNYHSTVGPDLNPRLIRFQFQAETITPHRCICRSRRKTFGKKKSNFNQNIIQRICRCKIRAKFMHAGFEPARVYVRFIRIHTLKLSKLNMHCHCVYLRKIDASIFL
jgi:hypothetical protein